MTGGARYGGIVPTPFDSFPLALSATATDLAANSTILPATPDLPAINRDPTDDVTYSERPIFVQAVSGAVKWREGGAQPAADAVGHLLAAGDGVILRVERGRPAWFWSSSGASVMISPAGAAPVRDTGFEMPTAPADE